MLASWRVPLRGTDERETTRPCEGAPCRAPGDPTEAFYRTFRLGIAMPEDWHALPVEAALEKQGSHARGLAPQEAGARLARHGPNELQQLAKISRLRIFASQFKDVLVVILIIAAVISATLGILNRNAEELYDAVLISIIVVLNGLFGYVQEYRAEKSLEALRNLAAPRAHVLRGGEPVSIPARELVPGDIVLLTAGDKVPADLRLLEVANLQANEASLTGESVPVSKRTDPLPAKTFLADRRNMAYMGTIIDAGRGKGLVVATAMGTELGKIAGMVQEQEKTETPLQGHLDKLGRQIGLLILGISIFVFAVGYAEDPGKITDLFLTAVSLAVAAIPEGLPAVVTISLALGVQRMVRRHALIRKLPAVEALGSATVICSDKTGTLTKGEMNVRTVLAGGKEYELVGEGFDPDGEIRLDGLAVDPHGNSALREALVCGVLCNDATVKTDGKRWTVEGDPTEGALVVAAMRGGLNVEGLRGEQPRLAEVPFTSERKMMSTLNAPVSQDALHEILAVSEDRRHLTLADVGAKVLYVKGAPERVLAACTHHLVDGERRPLTEYDRKQYVFKNQEMATRALRVLGLASRSFPAEVPPLTEAGLEAGLTFLGLAGMMDAPRKDAMEAIARAKRAGIQVVMITGDHKLTAMAVAREMGILEKGDLALTGEELDAMPEEELRRQVEHIRVYARVSPEHKMRIVDAWRAKGHVVAMTGDGVNDAPALKRADLGVSMGITGTDVAKESAEIVLTDDNFASIIAAVEEGRGIYENIRKFVAYLLSANAGEVAIMFLATLMFTRPEYLPFFAPVQLLWINLVTDGLPALALGVDPYPKDVMERPPRNPKEGVISREVLFFMVVIAAILTVGTLGIFVLELNEHADLRLDMQIKTAQSVAFATIVFFELFLVFAMRSPRETLWKVGLLSNKRLLLAVLSSMVLQFVVVQVGLIGTPLDIWDWLQTFLVAITAFLFVEATKVVRRGLRSRAQRARG